MINSIVSNLSRIKTQITTFEVRYAREKGCVQCLAVSKSQPVGAMFEIYQAGVRDFAENTVQSALQKIHLLPKDIGWHFIGSIQSNKTKMIAQAFDWVHSVDREKIAYALNAQRLASGRGPLNVCIEVNVNQEITKSGVFLENVLPLAEKIITLPGLRLRGLMAIPQQANELSLQRQQFSVLKKCFDTLKQAGFSIDTLSMGMTQDFEAAIAEGATMVRIGEGIFGKRR
jgi:PLP dependent protein